MAIAIIIPVFVDCEDGHFFAVCEANGISGTTSGETMAEAEENIRLFIEECAVMQRGLYGWKAIRAEYAPGQPLRFVLVPPLPAVQED